MAARQSEPVWKRKAPAKAKHSKLSSAEKASARASAKRAGRPYPNLVDNMRVARKKSKKKTVRKKAGGKTAAHKKGGRKSA